MQSFRLASIHPSTCFCLLTENSLHLLNNNFRHERNATNAENESPAETRLNWWDSHEGRFRTKDEPRTTSYKKPLAKPNSRSRVSNVNPKTSRHFLNRTPSRTFIIWNITYTPRGTVSKRKTQQWSEAVKKTKGNIKEKKRVHRLGSLVENFLPFGQFTSGSA